ncbi:hypothetical protein NEIPOLOT_01897 [Neisseria polysaccharea ATCC 43768]|nr:hypothetical protein NEIPOLOT_01897 [Neisseria polysaccharea ATCC 43768]
MTTKTDDKNTVRFYCNICNSLAFFSSHKIPRHPLSSHFSHHPLYIYLIRFQSGD